MTTQTARAAAVTSATPFQIAEAHYRKMQTAICACTSATPPAEFATIEAEFMASAVAVDAAPASTLEEFARSFIIAVGDGESLPSEATLDRLFADARRLTSKDA
jgi:hypothetical protein